MADDDAVMQSCLIGTEPNQKSTLYFSFSVGLTWKRQDYQKPLEGDHTGSDYGLIRQNMISKSVETIVDTSVL